jgi:hypothetical protein
VLSAGAPRATRDRGWLEGPEERRRASAYRRR